MFTPEFIMFIAGGQFSINPSGPAVSATLQSDKPFNTVKIAIIIVTESVFKNYRSLSLYIQYH